MHLKNKKLSFLLAISVLTNSYLANANTYLIDESNFRVLASKCAPTVSYDTLYALVKTESSFNPFAIGVVNDSIKIKQAKNIEDALVNIQILEREGKNYSIGLGQINKFNFKKLGLSAEQLLDPCTNLKATASILNQCFLSVSKFDDADRLAKSLSCYYSGNEVTGFKHGYIDRVKQNSKVFIPSISILSTENINKNIELVINVEKSNEGLIF